MRAKLLAKEDYQKLRKMGINELIRFLEEGQYKGEIDALAKEYKGMELLDLALNASLANALNKLLAISKGPELQELVGLYARKRILHNFKVVLRAKANQMRKEEIKYGIVPIAPTTYDYCLQLAQKDNDSILREIEKASGYAMKEVKEQLERNSLAEAENRLDVLYYGSMAAFATRVAQEKDLAGFFRAYIDLVNIRSVFRMKGSADHKAAEKFVVGPRTPLIAKLLDAHGIPEAFDVLRGSKYAGIVPKDGSITALDNAIDRYLLRSAGSSLVKPMGIAVIFGYLIAKEIEVRNLRLLLSAKANGLSEEFIDQNLIV